ncbi:MAG: ATP-binding protein [Desulfobacter sp.]|nr:MAG: ATP-binding protein [Desulfobacter sp.]
METRSEKLNASRTKLKRGILVNMILIPMVPFFLVMSISFYFFSSALETGTQGNLTRILSDQCQMIESFLIERKADLALITRTFSFDQICADQAINAIYKNLEKRSAAFVDLGLFDEQGIHLRYSGDYALAGKSYAREDWFKKTMARGYYISDIFLGYRNTPHFVVAVRRSEQNRTWVLRATIDTLFFDTLVSGVRVGKTGEAYILNREGQAQTARRSGDIALLEQDPAFEWFGYLFNSRQASFCISPKGQPFLYAVTRLRDKSWLLVVRQEKQDAYRALYSAAIICLIIMVCGLAVLVVAAVFTSERIVRQIERLDGEKEQLGSQLIRAVQLAEIGEMVAGFAHEINNPLQIIKSEYALLKLLVEDLLDKGSPALAKALASDPKNQETTAGIHEGLDQIHRQVERCHKITSAILKFGRKNEIQQIELDPQKVIPDIMALVENKARVNGVELITRIPGDAPWFMGDLSRFQQVVLNLLNNAMDAVMERHGSRGGVIEVFVDHTPDQVDICVKDNGCGIKPEHMTRLFSPFFTTKAVGRGTGLGLSVCYGIIESFGGTMTVESHQGEGTVFVICLPAKQKKESLP